MQSLRGRAWWAWCWVLAVLSVAGCESRVSLGARCESSAQCVAGLRCQLGRCRAECVSAGDCAGGALCVGEPGVCTVPEDTCATACPEGFVCTGTLCEYRCDLAHPCRDGALCQAFEATNVCVAAPRLDAGPDDAGPDDDAPDVDASVGVDDRHTLCAGANHVCAIRDGAVYCWGYNQDGTLGDGTSEADRVEHENCGGYDCADHPSRPVQWRSGGAVTALDRVDAIACGESFTCAIRDGAIYCWGGVGEGFELGYSGYGRIARLVEGARPDAVNVYAGRHHACARFADETVACWGWMGAAYDGRLGSVGDSTRAPRDVTTLTGIRTAALGPPFTCFATDSEVRCVGFNESGVTGAARYGADPSPAPIEGLPGRATSLAAGDFHACAIVEGAAYCWGGDNYRVLGNTDVPTCFPGGPVTGCSPTALPVSHLASTEDLVALSTGMSDTMCAIGVGGHVLCWGRADYGQAGVEPPPGNGNVMMIGPLVEIAPGDSFSSAREVSCGAAFCCARTERGSVYCWGENDLGQLGRGVTDAELWDGGVSGLDGGLPAYAHPIAVEVEFP
ncbi:MAG: hypothetical protein U0353_00150 [Sandaracinus sp.]